MRKISFGKTKEEDLLKIDEEERYEHDPKKLAVAGHRFRLQPTKLAQGSASVRGVTATARAGLCLMGAKREEEDRSARLCTGCRVAHGRREMLGGEVAARDMQRLVVAVRCRWQGCTFGRPAGEQQQRCVCCGVAAVRGRRGMVSGLSGWLTRTAHGCQVREDRAWLAASRRLEGVADGGSSGLGLLRGFESAR